MSHAAILLPMSKPAVRQRGNAAVGDLALTLDVLHCRSPPIDSQVFLVANVKRKGGFAFIALVDQTLATKSDRQET